MLELGNEVSRSLEGVMLAGAVYCFMCKVQEQRFRWVMCPNYIHSLGGEQFGAVVSPLIENGLV